MRRFAAATASGVPVTALEVEIVQHFDLFADCGLAGNTPVVLTIGGFKSQPGVTVAVQ